MIRTFESAALVVTTAIWLMASPAQADSLQKHFNYQGPSTSVLSQPNGSDIYYSDTGFGRRVVVFIGGAATTSRVVEWYEHVRSFRKQLGIRVITVGKEMYGATQVNEDASSESYADRVDLVLDELGIHEFSLLALSAGGAYVTEVARRHVDDLTSVHLLSAIGSELIAEDVGTAFICPLAEIPGALDFLATDAVLQVATGLQVEDQLVIDSIPGFRGMLWKAFSFANYSKTSISPGDRIAIEIANLICRPTTADVSEVDAPVFIYQGNQDLVVIPAYANFWASVWPNVEAVRLYEGEGHLASVRHAGQIWLDVAGAHGRTLICHQGRKTRIVRDAALERHLAHGDTLDICSWAGTPGE